MTFALITDSARFQWLDLVWALPLVVLLYVLLCWVWPSVMLRPLWWLITHTIYRLRIHGREHIPSSGPVLIVSNHVSFIDWLLIWAASPRPVRFLASASHTRHPILAFFLRMVRIIPVDDQRPGPRSLVKAFRQCAKVLESGEVLVVFAEGNLTRSGTMLPFHRGFERIIKLATELTGGPIPIVPCHLSHVWGSIFSYHSGRVFWKRPLSLPYPVAVGFGPVLDGTTRAPEVREQVRLVGAKVAIEESYHLKPLHRRFVRVAARYPLASCFVDTSTGVERKLNYARAYAGVVCLSRWLRSRVGENRFVGVWLPSSMGGCLANIALAMLHKTSVNLNYTAGAENVRSSARQTNLRTVITSRRFLERIPLDLPDDVERLYLEDAIESITTFQRVRSFLSCLLFPGWFLEYVLLGLGNHRITDLLTIIFSSGSTGEPKGVMLSQRNVASNIESLVQAIDLEKSDRLMGMLPFFHSFGYTVTVWGPLVVGASVVYWPDPRQGKEIGDQCKKYQVTINLGTATFMRIYLRRCDPDSFRTVRVWPCGAEKLPMELADEFEKKFELRPTEGYGCTELSPVVAVNVPDREVNGLHQAGSKKGTVGQAIPGVAVKVCAPESVEPLPIGEEGVLWVTGPNVMEGYLNQPEKTADVVLDGWYNTGDMARIGEDGFITITGRLSRFAKIGGEMIPLERVEQELHNVLETTDRVFAVTALPDSKRGERIIILHTDMSRPACELVAGLRERGLPNLWIPGERDFFSVEELPILGSGKLDLKGVRKLAEECVS